MVGNQIRHVQALSPEFKHLIVFTEMIEPGPYCRDVATDEVFAGRQWDRGLFAVENDGATRTDRCETVERGLRASSGFSKNIRRG